MRRALLPLIRKGQEITGLPLVTETFVRYDKHDTNTIIGCCPLTMLACGIANDMGYPQTGPNLVRELFDSEDLFRLLETQAGLDNEAIREYYWVIDNTGMRSSTSRTMRLARFHKRALGL